MSLPNENFEIVDMEKKSEPKEVPKKKKIIVVKGKNPEDWIEGKTKKGDRTLYRKYREKYVNIGFFKSGHVYITYDGAFVKDHGLKYENDEQIKRDTNALLETLLIIDN